MANKDKKQALNELDSVTKEYEQICSNLKDKYKELDSITDKSIKLISSVEALVESIKHRPWSFGAIKHKISIKVNKYVNRKDLERKERNKNIKAAAVAGGVAFAGGITIFGFMREKFKYNILMWIFGLVFFVFVLIGYGLYKVFNRTRTTKQAYEEAKKLKEESKRNLTLLTKSNVAIQKMVSQYEIVENFFIELNAFNGTNYRTMPQEKQQELGTLYNHALVLAELVNNQIG